MARYLKTKDFKNDTEAMIEFVKSASPGELIYLWEDYKNQVDPKTTPLFNLFRDSSTTVALIDSGEHFTEALKYYRSQGEAINTEADLFKVMAFRLNSYGFIHHKSDLKYVVEIIENLVKYYKDPLAAANIMIEEFDGHFYSFFNEYPPTNFKNYDPSLADSDLKPFIQPHLTRNFGRNLFNMGGIHTPEDLESLWAKLAKGQIKEELLDDTKQKAIYDKYKKSDGSEKNIRQEILNNNLYAMTEELYNKAWGKDDYEAALKTYDNANPGEQHVLQAKLAAHSSLAKIAAVIAPEFMEYGFDNDSKMYDMAASTEKLALFLGHLADISLNGLENVTKLNPELWTLPGNDILPYMPTPEEGSAATIRIPRAGGIENYYKQLKHGASPTHVKMDQVAAEATQEERKKQKLLREREANARDGQIQALKESMSELKGQLQSLSRENSHLKEKDSKAHSLTLATLRSSTLIMRNEASRIAYAACAEHLREKLMLQGKDIEDLSRIPSLKEMADSVKRVRDERMNTLAKEMIADGKLDPRESLPNADDIASSDFISLKLAENLAKSFLSNDTYAFEKAFHPEIEQLKNAQQEKEDASKAQESIPDEVPTTDDQTKQEAFEPAERMTYNSPGF